MKKPWLIPFLIFDAVLIGALVYYFAFRQKPVQPPAFPEENHLPVLSMKQTDGADVFLRGLSGKVILIFFNPDCDHCQNEAKAITENKIAFQEYHLYFISSDSVQNIEKFASDYQLRDSNFHLGHVEPMDVYRAVGPIPSVPAIFIYNDRKLVKQFAGETKLEELMKFL